MSTQQEDITTDSTPEAEPPESGQEKETVSNQKEDSAKKTPPPLAALFGQDTADFSDEDLTNIVNKQIQYDLSSADFQQELNLLFLLDQNSITRSGSDRIYNAVSEADPKKRILLVLSSPGGDIAAAYFIAKLCREYTQVDFEVAVPRQAKSAATLICCGADKIHMGSLSELGPIDPQFGGVPALALKHSVEHLAQLAKDYPDASAMFSDYLSKSLRVEALGYYERVAQSATHYAIRLLDSRRTEISNDMTATQIANRLVYEYADHGFVIDSREALEIFSSSVVFCNTSEYKVANLLYQNFDFMSWIFKSRFNKELSYVGNIQNGCWLLPARNT